MRQQEKRRLLPVLVTFPKLRAMMLENVPEFEGRRFETRSRGVMGTLELLVNGEPAPRGTKKNAFLVRDARGREREVELKSGWPDPSPTLIVEGQKHRFAPPFSVAEWIVVGAPLILFLGGCIGGLIGGIGLATNAALMRSN